MVRQRGKCYHYQFMMSGKKYYGVCEGCTTKRAAEVYEKKIKDTVAKAVMQKDVKTLVENFRDELSGGVPIRLAEAFELSLSKPRSRSTSENFISVKREAFRDFVQFMKEQYPDVCNLSDVLHKHAEEYITIIRTSGRYVT